MGPPWGAFCQIILTSCYQLRQLRAVRRTPSAEAAKTLVHALITTRVDYCNSVLYGVTTTNLRPLQSVINAAARLITAKRKFDHITDTLVDLHWLPVRQHIQFKLCSLVSECQRRTAPSYLADICISVSAMSGRTHLRSAIHCDLVVPRTRLTRYGPRSFAVSGPATWNRLPPDLRGMSLRCQFLQLKTELFIRAYYMRS